MKLNLKLMQPSVLVGESLKVEVDLVNDSSTPVAVPSPNSTSEFEYVIRSTPGDGNPIVLSARRAIQASGFGRGPASPKATVSLAPGEQIRYQEDLGDYAGRGLPPGRYLVSVLFGEGATTIESTPASLAVFLPAISALAVASSPGFEMGTFFVHRESGQQDAIFQQESPPGQPLHGTAERRVVVPSPEKVLGVSGAYKLDSETWERWFAWLRDDDAMGGGLAWGKASYATVEPQSMGMRNCQILSYGWQQASGAGTFAVLGQNQEDQLCLVLATLRAPGTALFTNVRLDGVVMPDHWIVAALIDESAEMTDFMFISAFRAGDGTRLTRQRFSSNQTAAEPPETLTESNHTLLALALDSPFLAASGSHLNALFESEPVNGKESGRFVSVPLGAKAEPVEWTVAYPEREDRLKPSGWCIASSRGLGPVILAKLDDQLLVSRPSTGTGWSVLATNAARAEHLKLHLTEDSAWAIWSDPASGLVSQLIP